ncbi:MAG: hypothetical protein DRP15_03700, partial [Candidatus Aenigmatarchaeota archaeon]
GHASPFRWPELEDGEGLEGARPHFGGGAGGPGEIGGHASPFRWPEIVVREGLEGTRLRLAQQACFWDPSIQGDDDEMARESVSGLAGRVGIVCWWR